MKSPSQHSFASVPSVQIPRSAFRRNMTYKTTFNGGYLIPIYLDEVLPGDTFNLHLTQFCRLQSPLKYPLMDNMYLDTFFFFVPNRLVWDHWPNCMGERPAGNDFEHDTDYLVPVINSGAGFAVGSLADYLGLPTGVADLDVSALPLRAYNRIFNEWFRDENLVAELPLNLGEGPDNLDDYKIVRRAKNHDYFTSALPWPQKGPSVDIPLGGYAPVVGNGSTLGLTDGTNNVGAFFHRDNAYLGGFPSVYGTPTGSAASSSFSGSNKSLGLTTDPAKSGVQADLSSASAATINSLRQAFQVQRLYERDAVGGSRYIELIRSHFGVISPDARLQRSEYLGGGSIPIQIHTVASTNGSSTPSPTSNSGVASLGAYGVTASMKVGFSKSFVEHGWILGLCSVRCDQTYQQGLDRMWSRRDRFDFYWPALSHLGEQAILNKEIYAQGKGVKDDSGNVIDDNVFGYQERYGEYRYNVSKITGMFRSAAKTSLDVYHLAQDFANLPTLSKQFIEENSPIDRVVAFGSTVSDQFLYDSLVELNCVRPMPLFGTPGMIDHF